MKRCDVHFCLLSEQMIPNLLPVVNRSTRPQLVVCLVTPRMARVRDRLDRLKAFLIHLGCECVFEEFSDFNYGQIQGRVEDLLARYRPRGEIMLNATGGTKIMSLGALEVFRRQGLGAVYVDSQNGQFIPIGPEGGSPSPIPGGVFTVDDYIRASGYEVTARTRPQPNPLQLGYARYLLEGSDRLQRAQAKLNFFAGQVEEQPWEQTGFALSEKDCRDRGFCELLGQCHRSGFLQFLPDRRRLVFHCPEGWNLIRGGWLEFYLAPILERLQAKGVVRDFALNLEVLSPRNVRNELDGVFTANNRLHILECKSGRMRGGKGKSADTVVYKLDNLRDLIGGDYGKAMLVTYWPVGESDRRRLGENGMHIAEGKTLLGLERLLQVWASNA